MPFVRRISIGIFVLFTAQSTLAATATGNLPISATVINNCVIGTVVPVAFGNYDPTLATPNNAGQGTIPVTCTLGDSYTIALGFGTFSGATLTNRRMTGTTAAGLLYQLYQDAGRTTVWGNTPGTNTPAAVVGTGTSQSVSVYGQIPALQAVAAGGYTDTVVITVTF